MIKALNGRKVIVNFVMMQIFHFSFNIILNYFLISIITSEVNPSSTFIQRLNVVANTFETQTSKAVENQKFSQTKMKPTK